MVIIYGDLEKDNNKVFKFHMNNSSFFEIIIFLVTLFQAGFFIRSLPYDS